MSGNETLSRTVRRAIDNEGEPVRQIHEALANGNIRATQAYDSSSRSLEGAPELIGEALTELGREIADTVEAYGIPFVRSRDIHDEPTLG